MISLKNKKVIITGAAAGIGKAIAMQCIKLGATIIAIDMNESGILNLKKNNKKNNYTFIITGAVFDINNGCYLR
ncbi:MAG: SDR family NAD(P)-dependent oxidoreductase [Spirochaetales bacterium]|nr:SDR family NAD(P)-dependent oxidoreductase [Spirochaetales bacterium]